MSKLVKNIGLIFFVFSVACAVSNWGGEFTRKPVAVFSALILSIVVYAIGDYCD